MGNLQANEAKPATNKAVKAQGKVKSLMKIRGKRNKNDASTHFTNIIPTTPTPTTKRKMTVATEEEGDELEGDLHGGNLPPPSSLLKSATTPVKTTTKNDLADNDGLILVTDSWCKVNRIVDDDIQIEKITPPSQSAVSSSSDSNFTDPLLTPMGFSAEMNQCYYSEESVNLDVEVPNCTTQDNFLQNFTLNSFKLNEHCIKRKEEKCKKLSKLGVSKTSQISLETDPNECFVSENVVEVVRRNDDEEEEDSEGDGEEIVRDEGTLKRRPQSESDGQKVAGMVKRMSDASLSNEFVGAQPEYKRHFSVPAEPQRPNADSLVLKKVASLILNKAELEAKIVKPKFVPEKLDFQLYEKFEGHMLVNWYLSEYSEDHDFTKLLNNQELKLLAIQFCTHLLAAGVLRQIPDKDVPMYNIFKPDCMYYWSHAETPMSVPQTPGRLSMVSWPPMSPSEVFLSTNAHDTLSLTSPRTPDGIPLISSGTTTYIDTIHDERPRQEFKNSARDVEILSLEEEINRLRQEVEKYKTVIEIQQLTEQAVKDFSSPIEEEPPPSKSFLKSCDISFIEKCVQTDLLLIETNNNSNRAQNCNEAQSISTQAQVEVRDQITETCMFLEKSVRVLDEVLAAPVPPPPPPPPLPPVPATSEVPVGTSQPPPPPPPLPSLDSSSSGPTPPPPPPPPPPPSLGSSIGGPPPPPPPPLPSLGSTAGVGGPPPPPPPPMIPGGVPPPPPPPMGSATGGPPPPPPPLGGPVPLPVPPEGGWNSQKSGLRKPTVNPSVPMKPLYWTRILATPSVPAATAAATITVDTTDSPDQQALWNEIDELPLDNLTEFADLFSRQVVARKPTVKKQEQKAKVGAVKLLDSKRSQNVGILAQSLHIEFQEIENAIYNFDTSIVSLEALQQIYEVRATREELELIKGHQATKPDIPLDKPEQFLYELSEISNFAERISCLMFQVEFDDSISTIGNTLTNIKTTCEYMISNPELKQVFAIILTLGNYMNGGNMSRGQADGFGLEILSKLKDVKSKDSKITLLHFIVRMYMKKIENPFEPNIALPIPEPGDIRRAASVNFDDVKVDLVKLERQLKECEKRVQKVVDASTPENLQPFKDKMSLFLENSAKQLSSEFENLDECKIIFLATMKFYLFKPKSGTLEAYPPNSFFEMWLPFCVDFKDIFKKELLRLETEKIQEIKKRETERLSENVRIKERKNGLKSKVKIVQAKHASQN